MLNVLTKLNNTPYQGLSIHRLGNTILNLPIIRNTCMPSTIYMDSAESSHITSQKKVFSNKSYETPFMNIRQISERHVLYQLHSHEIFNKLCCLFLKKIVPKDSI